MTLQEILDKINTRMQHALTNAQIIDELDEVQKQLFRDQEIPDEVAKFETAPNISFYTLPDDCQEDRINYITINGYKYELLRLGSDAKDKFCTIIQGQLMIYPTPTTVMTGLIYFYPSPNVLSADDLTTVPTYHKDYHMVFVWAGLKLVADSQNEIEKYNNYEMEFREVAKAAKKSIKKNKSRRVMARPYV